MENADTSLAEFAQLAAEGCRRFGNDPKAVATYVEAEMRKRPTALRRQLEEHFALWADASRH